MNHALHPARHSGTWATRCFAADAGEDISEPLLFGLGRTAWYSFNPAQPHPFLRTFHPERVSRIFMALNVPTETFHFWTTKPLQPLDLLWLNSTRLLLEVDQNILEAGVSESELSNRFGRYCVWVKEVRYESGENYWPWVTLQVPGKEQEITVDGAVLAAAWRTTEPGVFRHTCYAPYSKAIRWKKRAVIEHAVQHYVRQMRASQSAHGYSGIKALRCFTEALERDDKPIDFETTRYWARSDGGAAAHRDLLADFFLEAADVICEPQLERAAAAYRGIATAWRSLLCSSELRPGAAVVPTLHAIAAAESEALELLQHCCKTD
jgi:hypothetical protein